MLNQRNQRVNVDHFSMVPRADIPRSTFRTQHTHKTTINGGNLYPIYVDEILPGDHLSGKMTLFARMNTLLFPIMDHITAETFFFFVPNRLTWTNWIKFMGERKSPADSIAYTVPYVESPLGGFGLNDLYDHMGLPTAGQVTAGAFVRVNAMPLRAYNQIYNEWFRDENIDLPAANNTGDGPDVYTDYNIQRRRKKHDYFTSALPWPLKGGVSVKMPLTGSAPVRGLAWDTSKVSHSGTINNMMETAADPASGPGVLTAYSNWILASDAGALVAQANTTGGFHPQIYADLSQATGATIAALRLAVQTQRLLERDARGGTRYTELLRAHFGVMPEDARLQRPEYIGGGKSSVQTQAIPQTSATGLTGGASPLGALGAQSIATGQHTFRYSSTEHGVVIGLIHFDAELTYQQGMHRMWTRQSRYDYYWPVFAHLSEQPIRNDEIYATGTSTDTETFGYQERWAEYRHKLSQITGMFRSTSAGTIDPWHSAQKFASLPTLSTTFLISNPPFQRNLAAGAAANTMEFLLDMLFDIKMTRPMPMYSVPGNMDRF